MSPILSPLDWCMYWCTGVWGGVDMVGWVRTGVWVDGGICCVDETIGVKTP